MTRTFAALLSLSGLACATVASPGYERGDVALVVHQVDPRTGVESLAYGPAEVASLGGRRDADDLHLSVGAVYAARSDDPADDALALVFVGTRARSDEIFTSDRRVLLDVDGTLLTHAPRELPGGGSVERTSAAFRETLVVPIDRAVLEQLAGATAVGGRVGLWLTFDLDEESRRGFEALLRAMPAGAPAVTASDRPEMATPIGS